MSEKFIKVWIPIPKDLYDYVYRLSGYGKKSMAVIFMDAIKKGLGWKE